MPDTSRIIIRDRRKPRQWSTDNLIQDHWRPILGATGFDLYSLYLKLANKNDERAFPGYALIQGHLNYSSSTIRNYNLLLVWCELIHIESGNRFAANNYYILDVPEATPERLSRIRAAAQGWNKDADFIHTIIKRLDQWQPLQHWFGRNKAQHNLVVIHPNQLAIDMADTPGTQAPAPTSVAEDDDFGSRSSPLRLPKTTTSVAEEEQSEMYNPKQNNPKRTSNSNSNRNTNTRAPQIHLLLLLLT